ncbi:MAG: hypothetical protein QCH96_01840 [Candidatus Thermoplasmatota archaeon]|nr:hypothetical protein [Candidatus Thermoplasmatota archaeon]
MVTDKQQATNAKIPIATVLRCHGCPPYHLLTFRLLDQGGTLVASGLFP